MKGDPFLQNDVTPAKAEVQNIPISP